MRSLVWIAVFVSHIAYGGSLRHEPLRHPDAQLRCIAVDAYAEQPGSDLPLALTIYNTCDSSVRVDVAATRVRAIDAAGVRSELAVLAPAPAAAWLDANTREELVIHYRSPPAAPIELEVDLGPIVGEPAHVLAVKPAARHVLTYTTLDWGHAHHGISLFNAEVGLAFAHLEAPTIDATAPITTPAATAQIYRSGAHVTDGGLRLRVAPRLGYLVLGAEVTEQFPITSSHAMLGVQPGMVTAREPMTIGETTGAVVVGLRSHSTVLELSGEAALGGRVTYASIELPPGYDPCPASGRGCGQVSVLNNAWAVELRLRADLWLAPAVSLAVTGGVDPTALGAFSVAITLAIHARPYDGN